MAAVLNSDRLEVSVDGLTLSPTAEVPPCEAGPAQGEPAAGRGRAGPGSPGAAEAGGEAAEEAALSLERRWGFALEELYGLALRFFKGEPGNRGSHPHRGAPGGIARRAGLLGSGGAPGPLRAAGGPRRARCAEASSGMWDALFLVPAVSRGEGREQRLPGVAVPGMGRNRRDRAPCRWLGKGELHGCSEPGPEPGRAC